MDGVFQKKKHSIKITKFKKKNRIRKRKQKKNKKKKTMTQKEGFFLGRKIHQHFEPQSIKLQRVT